MKLDRDILRKLPLALRVEIEENAMCKPLTQSELAHQQRRILEELRKNAKPGARTDLEDGTSEKAFSQVAGENRATAVVGKLYGESHKQVEKRLAVLEAAEAEPERFGNLLANMDRTNRVNGNFKRLKVIRQADAIRAEPPPLPGNGPYRVLTADPAWPDGLRHEDPSHRANSPYHTEAIERICKHDIASIVHDYAILFLWVTNFILVNGLHLPVLRAWGDFKPVTLITWNKGRMGTGDRARSQTEHVILAIRGRPLQTCTNQSTWLDAVPEVLDVLRGKHSVKPREFYDLVESLCPAPRYADLFSRYRHNEKWDCYGDQAPHDDADSAPEHGAGVAR